MDNSPFGKLCRYRFGEIFEQEITFLFCVFEFVDDILVFFGVFILEAEVLELTFDSVETESVCNRRIDIDCLPAILYCLFLGCEPRGSHIVQSVGDLNKHHTDVVVHSQQ